jgi:hypothetical protein
MEESWEAAGFSEIKIQKLQSAAPGFLIQSLSGQRKG